MRLLRIPPSPLIFSTPGNVTSRPLQSPLWSFTSRTVNHDATLLHGSLDARTFSLRTIHTPNATQAESTSLGTQYTHICRNGSLDHKHSWGHPFFFEALFSQYFIFSPSSFLSSCSPSFFLFFTYRNPRHCRHVAESRLLPASQASPSWTALRRTHNLPLAISILHCT